MTLIELIAVLQKMLSDGTPPDTVVKAADIFESIEFPVDSAYLQSDEIILSEDRWEG